MKIRRFQITIQPCRWPAIEADYRDLSIEVVADGRMMTISHTIRNSDFEDTFGAMMREAEKAIRSAFKASKNIP